jgi:hypothetical protein
MLKLTEIHLVLLEMKHAYALSIALSFQALRAKNA